MRHYGAMRVPLLLLLIAAGPALADCPAAPDIAAGETALFDRIAEAETEMAAREISGGLWELWTQAPDPAAQALLDRGMTARAAFDFLAAREALDRLVDYCPDYAEGWNQRAFVSFLTEDYAAALDDLEVALALNPRHVGALSGKALTLIGLERKAEAELALRAALALNPWLSERHLLPGLSGEDI